MDGIFYPQFTRFLGTEQDPMTKLDCSFTMDQEAGQKDVYRVYVVWKEKYFSMAWPINCCHKGIVYYIALACNPFYNMMVEAKLEATESEEDSIYDAPQSSKNEDVNEVASITMLEDTIDYNELEMYLKCLVACIFVTSPEFSAFHLFNMACS